MTQEKPSRKDPLPSEFSLAMGKQIRIAREEIGLTQWELADTIELRRPSLSAMENGKMIKLSAEQLRQEVCKS